MKPTFFYLSAAALAVTLLTACHAGHDHDHEADAAKEAAHDDHAHDSDEITFTPAQAKAAGLQVTAVQPAEFAEVIEVSGRVLPAPGAEATVTATMAGIVRLATSALTDGAPVKAGRPLFIIDAHSVADGNPAAAAQSELEAARRAYERAERLAGEQIISQRELDEARQRFETATATARSLGNATQTRSVGAPLSGYLKNLLVKPGDYVAAGQPLATVTQSRRVQLRADVPERFYGDLPRIVSANFRMAYDDSRTVYSLKDLGGRLQSRGQAADAGDYFVPVTFEFDNRGDIVSGSFAQVYLLGATRAGVLSVPNEALTEAQGVYYVYVQTHADAYAKREVKPGLTDGRRTEILSGLKAGDKVVTHGATQVRLAASASVVPEGHSH